MKELSELHKEKKGVQANQQSNTSHAEEISEVGNLALLKSIEASNRARPDAGNNLELPRVMRERMQAHFGYDLSSVTFKESPEVSEMGAKAYAKGNAIKFAPGQFKPDTIEGRQMIGHELAHVVQQAQGGVEANIEDSSINFSNSLESMADIEGSKAASAFKNSAFEPSGAGLAPLPYVDAGSAPVQGWFGWIKKMFGGGKKNEDTAEKANISKDNEEDDSSFSAYEHAEQHNDLEYNQMTDEDFDNARNAAKTGKMNTVDTAMKLVSGTGSTASAISYLANNKGVQNGFVAGAGAAGSLGALAQAYTEFSTINGKRKKADEAVSGLNGVSSLGTATTSGASSALNSSELAGTMIEATALPIASIGGLVTGSADIISGLAGSHMAGKRKKELEQLRENNMYETDSGIARFASDAQAGKQRVARGRAVKGALTLGGGLALGAGALGIGALAATPIGWGLLAGAGLFGIGMSLYNKYKRHKAAKKMLNDENYMTELSKAGIKMPTEEDTAKLPWYKRWFNSQSEMKMDLIKGQIAEKMAGGNKSKLNKEILSTLGFKKKDKKGNPVSPNSREIYRSLDY
jgi:hypothetical protein